MVNEKEGKKKRKIVLASGTFDLLHLGHVKYLEEAKRAGGRNAELIVIVARDSTVEKRRGTKPIVPENQRRALVDSLKVVDDAVNQFSQTDKDHVLLCTGPNPRLVELVQVH